VVRGRRGRQPKEGEEGGWPEKEKRKYEKRWPEEERRMPATR
jgi:hypothetical protein